MKLLMFLIISFICIESRSYNNNNDEPGPSQPTSPAFLNAYTVESHESFRSTLELNSENQNVGYKSAQDNSHESLNNVISSENGKYFESFKESDKISSQVISNEKLLKIDGENLSMSTEESDESKSGETAKISDSVPCSLRTNVSNFLKFDKNVFEGDFAYSFEQENYPHFTRPKISIDVTHDVFETSSKQGLFEGIVYRRKLIFQQCNKLFLP